MNATAGAEVYPSDLRAGKARDWSGICQGPLLALPAVLASAMGGTAAAGGLAGASLGGGLAAGAAGAGAGAGSLLGTASTIGSLASGGAMLANALRPPPKLPGMPTPPTQPTFLGNLNRGNQSLAAIPPTAALGGTGGNFAAPAGGGKTLLGR